jgi:hypothetical protein
MCNRYCNEGRDCDCGPSRPSISDYIGVIILGAIIGGMAAWGL